MFVEDLSTLVRARNTIIMVTTVEEARAEEFIFAAGSRIKYLVRFWDSYGGLVEANGDPVEDIIDPIGAIRYIIANNTPGLKYLYVFRDLHRYINDPTIVRALRTAWRSLQTEKKENARGIILLNPVTDVPQDLSYIPVLDLPLPTREEVGQLLDNMMENVSDAVKQLNGQRDAAIDAALGLTTDEISSCYSKSIVSKKEIDPVIVMNEKKRVISRERVATWYEPDPRGMDGIVGMENLMSWLDLRRLAFSQKARDFGLPPAKGVFLVGVPGCGKSLTAKCLPTAWQIPLIRVDMGALKSKFVGESEANFRKMLKVVETVSPCIMWLDEIEKALAGSTGQQGDGGVSSDALGTILSWLQERTAPVFVVATANQVESLPAELLRKGRFDELFFVDLPNELERSAIFDVTLKQFNRSSETIDLERLSTAADGFTGSEIAAVVNEALFIAFADNARDITTEDILRAINETTPLSKTAADKIEDLRKWARGKTRPASKQVSNETKKVGRVLDM